MRLAAGAFVATLLLLACGCGGDEERQAQATYSFPDAPIVVGEPLERRVDEAPPAFCTRLPSASSIPRR